MLDGHRVKADVGEDEPLRQRLCDLGALTCCDVSWTVRTSGHRRATFIDNVSFTAQPGTLTAIIGPSGAGKSTLAKVIGGMVSPSSGRVMLGHRDVHAEYESLRGTIGLVPQDDVLHRQLTVGQALAYAAELRLPGVTSAERQSAVIGVLQQLELTDHVDTRVSNLSGGQRKRASVALELLTSPSVLILDEPTSGLDPALDRQVMRMLRRLADPGRVVIVVTHSLTYLDVCDQVIFMAPGGKIAYCGPPDQIGLAMGVDDWADIFVKVSTDVSDCCAAYSRTVTQKSAARAPAASTLQARTRLRRVDHARQVRTLVRRQIRLITADRGYFLFLTALPFILGCLSLAVPGQVGFGAADPQGSAPNEPAQLLMLLNMSAVFMGTTLTIRDLIAERSIFQRERSAGLSVSAYLLAKVFIFCFFAEVQSAVVVTIAYIGKGVPPGSGAVFSSAAFELSVGLAATVAVSALGGLLYSSLAKTAEQVMPILVISVMVSIVFSGGLIPVTNRLGLDQLSWAVPARWGFAATSATVDLSAIAPFVPAGERLWRHSADQWLMNMGVLSLFSIAITCVVWWRLRRCNHS